VIDARGFLSVGSRTFSVRFFRAQSSSASLPEGGRPSVPRRRPPTCSGPFSLFGGPSPGVDSEPNVTTATLHTSNLLLASRNPFPSFPSATCSSAADKQPFPERAIFFAQRIGSPLPPPRLSDSVDFHTEARRFSYGEYEERLSAITPPLPFPRSKGDSIPDRFPPTRVSPFFSRSENAWSLFVLGYSVDGSGDPLAIRADSQLVLSLFSPFTESGKAPYHPGAMSSLPMAVSNHPHDQEVKKKYLFFPPPRS